MKQKNCDNKTHKSINKVGILAASFLLLLVVVVSGTLAYLIDMTESVTNVFTPIEVKEEIKEQFDGVNNTKQKVYVQNTSETEVYIRATLVEYWKRESDSAIVPKPEGAAVIYDWGSGVNATGTSLTWFSVGDIYYYKKPLTANDNIDATFTDRTTNLLDMVTVTLPEGYEYYMEVHAEAIQAKPTSAVEEAWLDINVDSSNYLVKAN